MSPRIHKHLRRLDSVWIENSVYFLTICTAGRRALLANDDAVAAFRAEFEAAPSRYGWTIGRFVVTPDQLHFFCVSDERQGAASLSHFVGGFKQWTAKGILGAARAAPPLWQKQFFDHLLRSEESYEFKWHYVRENPVRAGLARTADEWAYGGEIAVIMR